MGEMWRRYRGDARRRRGEDGGEHLDAREEGVARAVRVAQRGGVAVERRAEGGVEKRLAARRAQGGQTWSGVGVGVGVGVGAGLGVGIGAQGGRTGDALDEQPEEPRLALR